MRTKCTLMTHRKLVSECAKKQKPRSKTGADRNVQACQSYTFNKSATFCATQVQAYACQVQAFGAQDTPLSYSA